MIKQDLERVEDGGVARDQGGKGVVKCGKCGIGMNYPEGCPAVKCPECGNVTLTDEALPLNCQFCKTLSYFHRTVLSVQCVCGAIYKVA